MDTAAKCALERALEISLEHLDGLDDRPVTAQATPDELRQLLTKPLNDDPIAPDVVLEDLARDAGPGLIGAAGGRFFGWVMGGSVPAALAADWLTSAWDQNAAMYCGGPSACIAEEIAGEWLKDVLRLPAEASFALVTGCNMAHVTCLAAARNALLSRRGWNVETQGLVGAPPIRILTSDRKHGSFQRAVRLVGLGLDSIVNLPVDDGDRLIPDALKAALQAEPDALTIVLLQAGDINIGAFDDFETLIPMAHEHQAWVHIDGAFGLWAAVSERYRPFLKGCDQADSWATDGHKWLNVPYDCGYAFVRDSAAHRASMTHRSDYVAAIDEVREQMDWNPEWSRRARGFATYAALRQLGRRGLEEMIDRCCRCARELVDQVAELPGAEALWRPTLNQGLLRFGDSDEITAAVLRGIEVHGGALFSDTIWRGKRAIRVSVCNWQTDDAHVKASVACIREVLAALT